MILRINEKRTKLFALAIFCSSYCEIVLSSRSVLLCIPSSAVLFWNEICWFLLMSAIFVGKDEHGRWYRTLALHRYLR